MTIALSEEDLDANHRLSKFAQFGSNDFISSPSPPPVVSPSFRLVKQATILDSSSGQLISTTSSINTESVMEDKVDSEPQFKKTALISAERPQAAVTAALHGPPALSTVHPVSVESTPTSLSPTAETIPAVPTRSTSSFVANSLVWLSDSLFGMGHSSSAAKKDQHNSLRHLSN